MAYAQIPSDPDNMRPISLINTMVKMLECIVYHRILPNVEPRLYENQYAYRRQRGTEHHLVSIMDQVQRALLEGCFAYMVSFDIAGAFDRVSHALLMQALRRFQVDGHTRRLLHHWIAGRSLVVKYKAPAGAFVGRYIAASSGLPQGGVLSPALWLMFFNEVHSKLTVRRALRGAARGEYEDYLFADDVTTVVIARTKGRVMDLAVANDDDMQVVMGGDRLPLQRAKTKNILFSPHALPGGIYRRAPPVSMLATRTRLQRQYQLAARVNQQMLDFEPDQDLELPPAETLDAAGFPYPLMDKVKVLGVQIDEYWMFDDHLLGVMTRSQTRQGILAKVAHSSWGLDADVLRITHDALLVSMLRYGLTVVGSCMPDDLLARIDVHVINTASRRITGLPIFTRIEALHFLAGTQSIRNLYIGHCAAFVHAVLCSHGSGAQGRLRAEVGAIFRVETLEPEVVPLRIGVQEAYLYPPTGLQHELLENMCWMQSTYRKPPAWNEVRRIGGIFFPNAAELRRETREYGGFYSFKDTHSWLDVGLQVLQHVGWRPECSLAQELNVPRSLPPDMIASELTLDKSHPPEDRYQVRGGVRRLMTQVWVIAGIVCVDEVCATVVILKTDQRARFCSGYVHGTKAGESGAVYMGEAVVLHALRVLKEWLLPVDQSLIQHVNILAGGALVHYQIQEWMTHGKCTLQSAAASGLVKDLQEMSEWLHIKTSYRPFYLPDDPANEDRYLNLNQELFLEVAEHFRSTVMPSQGPRWREQLPRVPMVTEELK